MSPLEPILHHDLFFHALGDEQALAGIYLIQDNRFVYINAAGARMFGYGPGEIVGRLAPADLVAPEDRALVGENIRRRLAGEVEVVHYSFRGLRQDGSIFDCEVRGRRIEYHNRPAILGILLDITERRQAEEELHRANRDLTRRNRELEALNALGQDLTRTLDLPDRFRLLHRRIGVQLLHAPHFTISRFDPRTQMILCEYAVVDGEETDPHRFPPLHLNAGPISETIRTRQARRVNLDAILPELGAWERAIPTDDERRPRSALLTPLIRDEQVTGVMAVQSYDPHAFQDVDPAFLSALGHQASIAIENARLFEQTRQQARQMQEIVETVPEGMLLLDGERRVVLANPRAAAYLSLWGDAGPGAILERLGDRPLDALLEAPPDAMPWHEVPAGQSVFEVSAQAIRNDGGAAGWVLVLRDVTDEREQQEHRQAQRRLATVGQLAAGIAHDFNNILEVIMLYGQMLYHDPDLPERKRYLSTINRQARHAADLIRQILDFSRRAVMQRQHVDLVSLLDELAVLLERTLPETIHIGMMTPDFPVIANVDPGRLQQALLNLAINARDAMPDGGDLAFRLTTLHLAPDDRPPLPEMAPGDWACITVVDSGCGMTAEVLAHVFEPFFTTKAPGKGSGLGLAQTYGIITQHGGSIVVVSQLEVGTTFTIYLPILRQHEPTAFAEGASAPGTQGRGTILVVEDDPGTRQAVVDIIDMLGYRVLSAAHGREALRIYAEQPSSIDLVLSDMVMPSMSGLDLYHALREQNAAVPMIVMTGYPLKDGGRSLLEEGIADWIPKPFSIQDLAEKLGAAVEEKPTR